MKTTRMIFAALLCITMSISTCAAFAEETYHDIETPQIDATLMTPDSQVELYSEVSTTSESIIQPFADPVVISYTIFASSSGQVEFSVTLKSKASSISISSVTLSTNGGAAVALSRPTTTASNTNYFEAFKTYTFATGNTYTLTCTWNIDGYKYTRSTTFSR